MQKTINGALLRRMIISGSKLLEINRDKIDALNVFPVPDGDTGTNMSLTLSSAVKEVNNCSSNSISELSDAIAKGALRGARGNSGVILSQILRGFCSVIKESDGIEAKMFSKALKCGAEVAYGAVSKPKEGTMLTVIRMLSDYAIQNYSKFKDLESFFPEILNAGNEALKLTPELLPVLKKAGVVDSGGMGLMTVLEGFYKALIGEEIMFNVVNEEDKKTESITDHADIMNLDSIEFAYCTEFFVTNLKKKTTLADIDKMREKLMAIGDSVICIGDLELVKVHVHTNTPGVALTYAIDLGELDKVKIENMLEQNRELLAKYESEKKEMGMLAICSGKGIADIFKDILVDRVIEGGQTMNPSASDIADAVQKINATHVFVFPNNKNIILAAEQAKALVENKTIHVIPTKNVPQGFTAALSFDPELKVEENKSNMLHSLDNITAGQVTYAIRTTNVDGFSLNQGDIIGLDNKTILAKGNDIGDVTIDLIKALKRNSHEIITLYYGSDVTEDAANIVSEKVQEAFPDCDIDLHFGGQPIYYYIVSLE